MSVTEETVDLKLSGQGTLRITFPSTLDSVNATAIKSSCLQAFTDTVVELEMNLTDTSFMDSAGVGILVMLYQQSIKTGQSVSIVGAAGQPLSLIQSVQIDKVIPLK